MNNLRFVFPALLVMLAVLSGCSTSPQLEPLSVQSLGDCTFAAEGSTMTLLGDCTTDKTVLIPDGVTLDGNGYSITAVDPESASFTGAVVASAGSAAYVVNLTVTASDLARACHGGVDRLSGILFNGTSGSITHSSVIGINQGASGCQEGIGILVRNTSGSEDVSVEIAHTTVDGYQKGGIAALGDLEVYIHHNDIGASATQENLAANSIQIGSGGTRGVVEFNQIDGNQWFGFDPVSSNFAGSAVLVFGAGETSVSQNNVGGNSDIGLFVVSDEGIYENNRLFDKEADIGGYDIGVLNLGSNIVANNKVRGYNTPYSGVSGGDNKSIPSPQE